MILLIFCLAGIALVGIALLIGYPTSISIHAWRGSMIAQGEDATTLRMVALHHLIVMGINILMVCFIFRSPASMIPEHIDPDKIKFRPICEGVMIPCSPDADERYDRRVRLWKESKLDYILDDVDLAREKDLLAVISTALMSVLILQPVKGYHYHDPDCRRICRRLTQLSTGGWIARTMILSHAPLLALLGWPTVGTLSIVSAIVLLPFLKNF